MATEFVNRGVVNGDLVIRSMTINIYADSKDDIHAPGLNDVLINKGMINGDVVFQNPSVNVYIDGVKQTAEVLHGEVIDLDDVVIPALEASNENAKRRRKVKRAGN